LRVADRQRLTTEAPLTALNDLVDRAIDYTNKILRVAPSYRSPALDGLRKLRDNLANHAPDDPAIRKLDAYLDRLSSPASGP
jgi:hypothetical protein